MVVFMLLTCVSELLGRMLRLNNKKNDWVYNLFLIAEAGFTTAMYDYFISKYLNRRPIFWIGSVLLITLYTYEIITHGIFISNDYTITIMSIMFIGYALYYYYLLMKSDTYVELIKYPPFWWIAGTLLFYYGSSASDLYFAIFKDTKLFGHKRYLIYMWLNIIQYGFWSYSFICRYQCRELTL